MALIIIKMHLKFSRLFIAIITVIKVMHNGIITSNVYSQQCEAMQVFFTQSKLFSDS